MDSAGIYCTGFVSQKRKIWYGLDRNINKSMRKFSHYHQTKTKLDFTEVYIRLSAQPGRMCRIDSEGMFHHTLHRLRYGSNIHHASATRHIHGRVTSHHFTRYHEIFHLSIISAWWIIECSYIFPHHKKGKKKKSFACDISCLYGWGINLYYTYLPRAEGHRIWYSLETSHVRSSWNNPIHYIKRVKSIWSESIILIHVLNRITL